MAMVKFFLLLNLWLQYQTRATFLFAELGFRGVVMKIRVHTAFFCGLFSKAGALDLFIFLFLVVFFLAHCLMVEKNCLHINI